MQLNSPAHITALLDATQDLRFELVKYGAEATVGENFETSALDMFTHVVRDESIVISDRDVGQLLQVTAERRRQRHEQTANIDAFESFVRQSLAGDLSSQARPQLMSLSFANTRDDYWTRVRSDLQTWFSIGLEDLANVVGVAKGTLIYINKPGRAPRPSTARKVMDLHALGFAVVEATGIDKARKWLSTTGIAMLHDGGVGKLDHVVNTYLYNRRRSEEAVDLVAHGETVPDSGPFAAPTNMEAEAF